MKKTMRCWSAAAFLFCALFAHQGLASESGSFVLVRDRAPAATFVLTAEQAGLVASDGIAAGMLDDFNADLRECAGCELPVSESDVGTDPVIRFAIETRTPEDEDRFAITFPDERTMLITGSVVSLRWALNHILQEFAGVRYLTDTQNGAHFPKITDLKVPRSSISVAPTFNLSRDVSRSWNQYWQKRMGNPTYGAQKGGRIILGHNLCKSVFPVKKYRLEGKFPPDFIFPIINGERYLPYKDPAYKEAWESGKGTWYGWQPCFTDKKVVDEAVKNIIDYFDGNPEVLGISMALNDMGGYCECDDCMSGRDQKSSHNLPNYSNLYYGWLNKIAEGVAVKYPHRYLATITYREYKDPPDFKLHSNIVVFLLYDAQQSMDAEMHKKRMEFFEGWRGKAVSIGAEPYYLCGYYDVPRVYFSLQQELLQKVCELGNAGHLAASAQGVSTLKDGPKRYLYHKLLWNVNLDLEETLREWYEACVGKEAAPYLDEYYRIWEQIWREEAVKTAWFQQGKKATYLNFKGDKSYLFAVGLEDLPKLRSLMEKVVELAERNGDNRQQIRADWLMRDFEYAEASVYAIGGHIIPPSGVAETVEQALAFLEFLPEAIKYDARRLELHEARRADRDIGRMYYKEHINNMSYSLATLARVTDMMSDPDVMAAMITASKNPDISIEMRELLKIFARLAEGVPVKNLMLDGGFETGNLDWREGVLSQEKSYKGKNSLKFNLSERILHTKHGRDVPYQRVEPGKYYISFTSIP